MAEDFKVQVNLKSGPTGQDLFNFRADSAEELANHLRDFEQYNLPALIEGVRGTLSGAATVGASLPVAPAAPQPVQAPAAPGWGVPAQAAAPAAPAANSDHTCQHGARQFKSGVSARGPWQAWFCPAPKGDPTQCKAVFVK